MISALTRPTLPNTRARAAKDNQERFIASPPSLRKDKPRCTLERPGHSMFRCDTMEDTLFSRSFHAEVDKFQLSNYSISQIVVFVVLMNLHSFLAVVSGWCWAG